MSRYAMVTDVIRGEARWSLREGDALEKMDGIPDGCIDAVVTDLPYAEINRAYGRMTEAEWEAFAHPLVRQCLRVLKPRGSAVFIIQPNSEHVGRMRAWAFRFMAWCADDLVRETQGRIGMVQDAWWWNIAQPPTIHSHRTRGLMRPSLKPCVWVGPTDCYRSQDEVLWSESDANVAARLENRTILDVYPSGMSMRRGRCAQSSADRGGVTPFNVLPLANTNSSSSAGASGHGAGTPYDLAAWWVRYLCPKGGVVLDPCAGTSTMGVAALRQGRRYIGIEKMADYAEISRVRLSENDAQGIGTTAPVQVVAPDFGPLFVTKP